MKERIFEKILKNVERPARYIGMEQNQVVKDFDSIPVKFAFCFPDVYEIGMSHLGMQILYFLINDQEDMLCERVFAPWEDMGNALKDEGEEIFSLENKRSLKEFDIVGFTLLYEMSYTNILYMLDLANIPFRAADRDEGHPLLIAGGSTVYNPEPMADFFDLFIIGEGEEINIQLFQLYKEHKKRGYIKEEFLKEASKLEGIYVPSFYKVHYKTDGTIERYEKKYENLPDRVKKRYVSNMNETYKLDRLLVPYIDIVHKRSVVELFRGCTQGCRFCQAGYTYRPVRERNIENIIDILKAQTRNTGYSELSLSSLSSCDYSNLDTLINTLMEEYENKHMNVSLPSLRVDSLSVETLKRLGETRRSGLTLAPEAGSQRMRDIINKGVTEEDYLTAVDSALDQGWSRLKLYFIVGLPFEERSDLKGIGDLVKLGVRSFFDRDPDDRKGSFGIDLSLSCFVPKPFTPFQWVPQARLDEFYDKIYYVRDQIKDRSVKTNYHSPETSMIEGLITRGDRKVSHLIEKAYELGAIFDGWTEMFDYNLWDEAMEATGISLEFYNYREREEDEIFPWEIIDPGVSRAYLSKEYKKSQLGLLTVDCRKGCNNCGIEMCEMVYG